jgi:hypothetical protein
MAPIIGIMASANWTSGNASSYESIATVTGNGSSTSLTFSSIPSTYKHLQIRGIGKTIALQRSTLLGIQFNSDTGANYTTHRLIGDGSNAAATGATATTYTSFRDTLAASQTSLPDMANIMGAVIIDILDYANTSKNKTVRGFGGVDGNYASVDFEVNLISGLWLNTAAISSITLVANDSFTTASTFALYGIKG